jgi:hypothetical protein
MAKRNRIMYASQSVRANGHLIYRVTTLGSNTTFTAEDIFELGQLDRIDVVDDVPAVAVTLDTNDWGTPTTMAILAGLNPVRMSGAPTASGSYLRTNADCTGSGVRYYHGVSLIDFSVGEGVKLWAPVQNEASQGTADDDIQMTLFMDKVFVNNITLTYNVGANATENYAAETDNKMWLVNAGKFISQEEWLKYAPANSEQLTLGIASPTSGTIPSLSNCKYAFLSFTDTGLEGVTVKASTDKYGTVYAVADAAASSVFGYNATTRILTLPTNAATLWPAAAKGYTITAVYAADKYAVGSSGDADVTYAKYFVPATSTLAAEDNPASRYPEDLGAVRQGQVEVYLVDPDIATTWDMTLRMQTVTVTATPTRTALNELGHQRPYARAMNLPVEITVATTAFASDLERWAIAAGLTPANYLSVADGGTGTGTDITLTHLQSKQNLICAVKVYQLTNEEAGGKNGLFRKVMLESLEGDEYYDWDGYGVYANAGDCDVAPRERPLKTVVVQGLKITAENYQNAVTGGRGGGGGQATQEMNFRATNKLFVVKGDVHIDDVACLERNTSADQF